MAEPLVDRATAPCAVRPRGDGYARRRPEETLLYGLVAEHWPRFLERAEAHGGLPKFVADEFDDYLRCGILEHGLVQLACCGCGHEMVVAFSCKRRGFCPSCLGRRMSDIAAHLVDEVFPEVPIRQWVCTLPWRLRYAMGYDRRLCADVLGAFIGALKRSLRWRAKRELNLRSVDDARVGALTFVQRADSSLRLNVHFHTLALDGVYVRDEEDCLQFFVLSAPSTEDVAQVAAWTHAALLRVLERHGRTLEGVSDTPDTFADDQPVLASCYGASAADVQLLGTCSHSAPPLGRRPPSSFARCASSPRPTPARSPKSAASTSTPRSWWTVATVLDSSVVVIGIACRYIARPPLSLDRLEKHPDGRVRVRFKSAREEATGRTVHIPYCWSRSTSSAACAFWEQRVRSSRRRASTCCATTLLFNRTVLAGHSKDRAEVVPQNDDDEPEAIEPQLPLFEASDAAPLQPPPPCRHPWPWLLQRVFAVDVMTCPRCEGAMKVVTIATGPDDILAVIGNLERRPRAPPTTPQLELDFAAA